MRLRRTALVLAVVGAILLGGTGCGRVDSQKVENTFSGLPGVIGTDTRCVSTLPFSTTCTVTVQVSSSVTAQELSAVLPVLRRVPASVHKIEVAAEPESRFSSGTFSLRPSTKAGYDYRVDDGVVVRAFLDGVGAGQLSGLVMTPAAYQDANPRAELEGTDDGPAMVSARRLVGAIPSLDVTLQSKTMKLSGDDGTLPEIEFALYEKIASEYPVVTAEMTAGRLSVQVDPTVDVASARSFAEAQSEFSAIAGVFIANDDKVRLNDADTAHSAAIVALADATRAHSENVSVTVRGSTATFAFYAEPIDRTLHEALSEMPEYQQLSVCYAGAGMTLCRAPAGRLAFDEIEALASSGVITSASIRQGTEHGSEYRVKIMAAPGTTPYELARAMAGAGLAQLPDASVIADMRGAGEPYGLEFTAASRISLAGDRALSSAQAAEFERGWADGQK